MAVHADDSQTAVVRISRHCRSGNAAPHQLAWGGDSRGALAGPGGPDRLRGNELAILLSERGSLAGDQPTLSLLVACTEIPARASGSSFSTQIGRASRRERVWP